MTSHRNRCNLRRVSFTVIFSPLLMGQSREQYSAWGVILGKKIVTKYCTYYCTYRCFIHLRALKPRQNANAEPLSLVLVTPKKRKQDDSLQSRYIDISIGSRLVVLLVPVQKTLTCTKSNKNKCNPDKHSQAPRKKQDNNMFQTVKAQVF